VTDEEKKVSRGVLTTPLGSPKSRIEGELGLAEKSQSPGSQRPVTVVEQESCQVNSLGLEGVASMALNVHGEGV
jgi:hypothetical protein